jgi:tetratricopeptide (TPR) repeat protein
LADQIVVPFAVTKEHTRVARNAIRWGLSPSSQASALLQALRESDELRVSYAPAATTTAIETLAMKRGNCFSIASVVVGLARSLGMTAYYVDVSHRQEEVARQGEFVVRSGHVVAIIATANGFLALDFDNYDSRRYYDWRAMDDLTATAHFYNNRGYELIFFSEQHDLPVPWVRVRDQFRMATFVQPDFARAWNNLGLALVHMGQVEEAEVSYREAITRKPRLISPYVNLAVLLLKEERFAEAIEVFERARQLNDRPRLAYHQALALWRSGRVDEAVALLEPLADDGYEPAKQLLQYIAGGGDPENGGAGRGAGRHSLGSYK